MSDILRAKTLLAGDPSLTCALVRGGEEETDTRRGVMPLLARVESGNPYAGYSAADRVVGRAAAFLYVLLNVKEVYAEVLSRPAEEVFKTYKIAYGCGNLTDSIVNHAGNGPCPMEEATMGVGTPQAALAAIRKKLKELGGR